jgi:CRP-like cAMP-binding protein
VRDSAASLVAADPELFGSVPEPLHSRAERQLIVRTGTLSPGAWRIPRSVRPNSLGFLVLSGFLLRELDLFNVKGTELLGAGDLLTSLDVGPTSVRSVGQWRVLAPTKLAFLDKRATERLGLLPGVVPELVRRAVRRSHAARAQLALARIHPLSTRLHVLFWNLADRWGKRARGIVQLEVPLSHQVLADLASAGRPKVTAALGTLAEQGLITRREPGRLWVVAGAPPKVPEEVSDECEQASSRSKPLHIARRSGHSPQPSLVP